MRTNIAFAKIGKSLKFISPFSSVGGDNEGPAILRALANNNPDTNFYVIGRSDMARMSDSQLKEQFPYENVIDVWKGAPNKSASGDGKNYKDPFYHHIGTYFERNNVKIDFTVMMVGQVGTVTVPGMIEQTRDRSLIASVIDMTKNYTTPISVWLNDYNVPYVEIVNDPRYVMNQSRDIFNLPAVSIGQYDWEYEAYHIQSYEDQDRVISKVKSSYAGMELGFCVGRKMPVLKDIKKSTSFSIVLNEGNPSRYDMLKEWVLNNYEDVEIYGRWDHKLAQPDVDTRFKGSMQIDEVQEKMSRTKYTLIIPIKDGWVTSKYIEMIHAGVIPFFHPSYDKQLHINVPAILRPKTPADMLANIKAMEDNPDVYEAVIKCLQDRFIRPEFYDGSLISKTIMEAGHKQINKTYEAVDVTKFKKATVVNLEDLFG